MEEKKGVIILLITHPPAVQSNRGEVGFVPDFTIVTLFSIVSDFTTTSLQMGI